MPVATLEKGPGLGVFVRIIVTFSPRPAGYYALDVVRRPAADLATLFSGGFIASGPTGASRAPTPVWPEGLALTRAEGAGEVQTPVRGAAAGALAVTKSGAQDSMPYREEVEELLG